MDTRNIPKHTDITLQQVYSQHYIKRRNNPINSTNSQTRQGGSFFLYMYSKYYLKV